MAARDLPDWWPYTGKTRRLVVARPEQEWVKLRKLCCLRYILIVRPIKIIIHLLNLHTIALFHPFPPSPDCPRLLCATHSNVNHSGDQSRQIAWQLVHRRHTISGCVFDTNALKLKQVIWWLWSVAQWRGLLV